MSLVEFADQAPNEHTVNEIKDSHRKTGDGLSFNNKTTKEFPKQYESCQNEHWPVKSVEVFGLKLVEICSDFLIVYLQSNVIQDIVGPLMIEERYTALVVA